MVRKTIYDFLEALMANNSKEWMDANRSWYNESKEAIIEFFDPILTELKDFDPRIVQPNARKSLNRINNNLMFHPERPTYKDHFSVVFGYGKGYADFYVGLGAYENDIAGGLWHPPSEKIKKIRTEIDYEGDRLREIVEAPEFKKHFVFYREDALKTTPKGYDKDHEHIDLLRLKTVAAFRQVSREEVFSDEFAVMVVDGYKTLVPMLDFINVAIQEE